MRTDLCVTEEYTEIRESYMYTGMVQVSQFK